MHHSSERNFVLGAQFLQPVVEEHRRLPRPLLQHPSDAKLWRSQTGSG
ncbi:MAG: hypothetical protein ACO25F_09035 [Erythrobacter sp.]